MKIRHLLAVVAASAAVASASAFEWTPQQITPSPELEVTATWQLESLTIIADANLVQTDITPMWIDEDENEIIATVSEFSDPNWGQYVYNFNLSDFKSNGEYILLLPQGMLKNAAGELSDKKEIPFTFEVPELAGAMFEDFKVLSITPDFSKPQGLWDNQVVTINTNHNDAIGMVALTITDNDAYNPLEANIVNSSNFSTNRELGDPNPITWTVSNPEGSTYKFLEGHNYTAEFVLYNGKDAFGEEGPTKIVSRLTYEFTGTVEGYKYSEVTLESIDPAPFTKVISEPSDAVFTYTFSGPVEITKAGSPLGQGGMNEYPSSCLSSNDDKTVWTLDLSDDSYIKTIDSNLVIYVYVQDLDGNQLRGDWGEESESCFTGEWQCELGAFPIVVVSPKSGDSIDCLSEVIVKSESGTPMAWSNNGEVSIVNKLGEVLGTLVYSQPEGDDVDTASDEIHFTKWMDNDWNVTDLNLVKEGHYAIQFSPGCFVMGEQFDSKVSRSLTSTLIITGALDNTPDDPGVDPAEQETLEYTAVDPENGSTVAKIDVIKISFAEDIMINGCDVVVYSSDQKIVGAGVGDLDWDNFAFDYVLVKLNEPITDPGRYMVSIPARSIGSDGYEEGKTGTCNPEIRLFYTIEGAEGPDVPGVDPSEQETFNYVKADPASGSTIASLSQIAVTFADAVQDSDFDKVIEVYDADDKLVTTATFDYNWDDFNTIDITLVNPVTDNGNYVVVIPSRTFFDEAYANSEGKSGVCNPEIRLSYTVDTGLGVDAISDASNSNVYDMQGRIVLTDATSDAIKTLDKGIYIVGGKKVVVK